VSTVLSFGNLYLSDINILSSTRDIFYTASSIIGHLVSFFNSYFGLPFFTHASMLLLIFRQILTSDILYTFNDSTPNKGSSKAKNILGYEGYSVLFALGTSPLPDLQPKNALKFKFNSRLEKPLRHWGALGHPIFAAACGSVGSRTAVIRSSISSSSMRVVPVNSRSMRCMVG
jgi:hypothetical protein